MSELAFNMGDSAPPPLPRRSEAEVMARWQGDQPRVSILCATYQHVDFIEDALRGFLGQDTDFPFEILVRDDASTDGTADIVRDYADRFPNIIRAVLETANRWPEIKPRQVLEPMVRGEFIAICEGDDYWIDPTKLSTQLALLEGNAWAAASHHDCVVVASGRVVRPVELPRDRRRNLTGLDAHRTAYLPVRTLLYRRLVAKSQRPSGVAGDTALAQSIAMCGGSVYAESLMAVYRRHSTSYRSTRFSKTNLQSQAESVAKFLSVCERGSASAYWFRKATFRALVERRWSQVSVRSVPLAVLEAANRRVQQGFRKLR